MKQTEYPLSVAHIQPNWLPQTMTWLYNQVKGLQALGVINTVLCERLENQDQFGDVSVASLSGASHLLQIWDRGLRKIRFRRHLGFYLRFLKKNKVDILHSHFGPVGWANLGLARALEIPHVVTFYGLDVNMLPQQDPSWRSRYHELFTSADLFLCEGPHMAVKLKELGCPEEKVKVHHFGIDLDSIPFSPRQWCHGEPLKVLLAATFREKKGLVYAIEALGQIRKTLPLELTIIGEATEEQRSQEERSKIISTLQETGLIEQTRLLGFQPQTALWKVAYDQHLFLSPSVTASDGDTEGGAPVGLMEMVASGMPVVSTTHCDIPFVLGKELKSYLAPERDVLEIVNIFNDITSNWSLAIKNIGLSRKRMELNFHLKIRTSSLLKKYVSLVNSYAARG